MSMVCPQCDSTFGQALQCPSCGVRLQYQAASRRSLAGALPDVGGQWQHTPWGRILIGVLLTQGLTYGLQMLCTAGILVADEEAQQTVWATLFGLILLQALQGLSLIIGGTLAGAGQSRGMFLGGLLGLAHTAVWMVLQQLRGELLTELALYAQPVLHLFFGALGGLFGSIVWRPLPTVSVPLATPPSPKKHANGPGIAALDGPIAWGRVTVGIGIVLVGLFWPKFILELVVNASRGQLSLQSQLQAQLITWEIIGLVTLFGAALAGATTRNGLKQGLCVGVGAAIVVIGSHLGSRNLQPEQMIFLTVSVLCLTIAGAWFGGQLFPPIQRIRRRAA